MRHPSHCLVHAFAAAALLCAATVSAEQAAAEDEAAASADRTASEAQATIEIDDAPTAEQMALDMVLMRPLSLVGTVIGTAVFIVALPINALTLNFKDPARRLILEPAKYTFVRPLGDLD